MTTKQKVQMFRGKISRLTDKQLVRLNHRIWQRIEAWYGCGLWDGPTLNVVYPSFYQAFAAISEELRSRRPPL